MLADGLNAYLSAREARLPRDVAGFLRAQPAERLRALASRRGMVGVADLRRLCAAATAGTEPDPDPENPCHQIEHLIATIRSTQPRLLLGRALALFDTVLARVTAEVPGVSFVPVGSLRRFEPTVGDVLILAITASPAEAAARVASTCAPDDVLHHSAQSLSFLVERDEVNVRFASRESAGAALIFYTGSAAHVRLLQQRAASRGLQLTPDGLLGPGGVRLLCSTEADIYTALDLPVIPSELRHGEDEIALAEQGALGALITLEHIQGDLHTHTLWSDGRDSAEGVIWAINALGYRYVAITDHSQSAAASRTLSIDALREQAREIEGLRAKYPSLAILHGTEVDILEDGRLDFPDTVLEGLDIVLASLHDSRGHDGDRLLERYRRACEHPLVNLITHPANRVPGRSEGYALDWDAFFRAAVDSATAVEIDGAPGHLDLDGHLARLAADAGATLSIDSDGHFADRLGRQMRMGVGTARRGAVPMAQVLNARPLDDVRKFIAAKRRP